MDFGVLSHKQTSSPNAECLGSAEPRDEKGHGSTNLKHQRSDLADDCWKSHKMLKPDEVDLAASGRSNLWPPPEDGQMMLSFSSSAPHCSGEMGDAGRSIAFSISRDGSNSTTGGGGLNGGMRGTFSRLKGPFTPSQWMELEHQALIYKHIVANVPVPFNLLLPLKGSLYSYGSPGSYASNFLGWSPFHLGFSGSNDPEPGRCRRTDGKKWRCSRDAVPDQKYCERHINRGRHRSRKPVEGQAGHAVSGTPAASKAAPIASSSSASLMSSSNTTNSLSSMQHRFSSLQSNTATASNDHLVSSSHQGLSLIPPTRGLKLIQEQQVPFEESEFGIVSSDCLLNPSEKISYMNTSSSDSLTRVEAKEANSQHPVHHFIDDWPKGQSDGASASWAEELKYDWTQLSMSIPIAPDFSSSSSSPAQEKSTLSTLRLSHEVEPIHKSLGVSHDLRHAVEKQPSWSPPIIWGNSMGGPLGEVLTSTNAGAGAGVGVNFLSAKDCRGSPHMGSSPTGVLQKSTFVSLSNSGSSTENVSLCNDLLGPALIRSATIPSV